MTEDDLTRAIRKVHADGNGVCLPTAVDLMDPVDQSTEDRLRDYAREILDALADPPADALFLRALVVGCEINGDTYDRLREIADKLEARG